MLARIRYLLANLLKPKVSLKTYEMGAAA